VCAHCQVPWQCQLRNLLDTLLVLLLVLFSQLVFLSHVGWGILSRVELSLVDSWQSEEKTEDRRQKTEDSGPRLYTKNSRQRDWKDETESRVNWACRVEMTCCHQMEMCHLTGTGRECNWEALKHRQSGLYRGVEWTNSI
jgi:hypothetical protein